MLRLYYLKELKKRAYYLFKKGETNDSKKSMAVP